MTCSPEWSPAKTWLLPVQVHEKRGTTKRSLFSEEQIAGVLKEAEVGVPVKGFCHPVAGSIRLAPPERGAGVALAHE